MLVTIELTADHVLAKASADRRCQTFANFIKPYPKTGGFSKLPCDLLSKILVLARALPLYDIPPSSILIPRPPPIKKMLPKWCFEKLFAYQREDVKTVINKFHGRAILAHEMGTGKTIMAVAISATYGEERTLVICPSYLRINWQNEFMAHAGIASQIIFRGAMDIENARVVISSYDLVRQNPTKYASEGFGIIICDESQYLKEKKSKRTKAIVPLLKNCKRAILLSGTPLVNRPVELWTQMHAVDPKRTPDYTTFTRRYCNAKVRFGKLDVSGSAHMKELNYLLLKHFMVRRTKLQVLPDLPPKIRTQISLQVDDTGPMDKLFKQWGKLNLTIGRQEAAGKNPHNEVFQRKCIINELFVDSARIKREAVTLYIRDLPDVPIVIFAYHICMLDHLQEKFPDSLRIDGSVAPKKRQAIVDAFQNGEARMILLSIEACKTGITLTRASLCVFTELCFVPADILQAEDRLHRIGQHKTVDYRYLLVSGGIDEHIFRIISRKLKVLQKVLDGSECRLQFSLQDVTVFN